MQTGTHTCTHHCHTQTLSGGCGTHVKRMCKAAKLPALARSLQGRLTLLAQTSPAVRGMQPVPAALHVLHSPQTVAPVQALVSMSPVVLEQAWPNSLAGFVCKGEKHGAYA